VDEFEELDTAIADARSARDRHRAEVTRRHDAEVDFERRFRDWAETIAAPTLEAVAEHVRGLYEYSSVHIHRPDRGAGHRESVDLNVSLMNKYVQLTFRALLPELAVGVSKNHGVEVAEPLESLTAEKIRHDAIELIMQAISDARQAEEQA
jgi:hypothetical protein